MDVRSEALPATGVLLRRGLLKRCPRCGSGRLFTRWIQMVDRCPRCNYLFEREEGFFLGAYVINFAAMEIGLIICMIISFGLTLPDPPTGKLAIIGCVVGVIVPILTYPFSKTIWTAIDLAMHRGTADRVGHNRFET